MHTDTRETSSPNRLRSRSPGSRLGQMWARLSPWPGGRWLFSVLFGFMVPYTGTIGARVVELRPGYARMVLSDRRSVRNHLNSIHAIALANLAEATSGLAMTMGLPDDARAIVTGLSVEYFKKARGTLTAECTVTYPPSEDGRWHVTSEIELPVIAEVRNTAGELVARATALWRVGPRTS